MEKFKTISSIHNPEIKKIIKLIKSKKKRKEEKCFIAEGEKICSALLSFNARPIKIYATKKFFQNNPNFFQNKDFVIVSSRVMDKISQAMTPSGLLGLFNIPEQAKRFTPGILLAGVSDPGNMGTLIRSCAAMGLKSVFIIGGADPWSFKVVQSTAGFMPLVNIFNLSWEEFIQNKGDLKLFALVVKDGRNPYDMNFENSILIIGNESRGIPKEWLKQCDELITLKMPGRIESLNAAVAGSIALYFSIIKS